MGSHIEMEMISEEIIKPSSPTPQILTDHKLSYLDQLIHSVYIPLIFFYDNPSSFPDHHVETSRQLKQSFSEALTKFYTFAGRVHGNTSVLCDDSGALFVEARARIPLSKALQNGVTQNLKQYLAIEPYGDGDSNDQRRNIPLVVKVSFFDCGGMAISICLFHQLADVSSLVAFMNVWAALQRGETEIPQPNLDLGRHYFPPLEDIPLPALGPPPDKVVMRRFVFDKEKIATIKELISSASNSKVQNPTRVEAVSAFIWKHIIDITRAKDDSKTTFALLLAVDLRPRIFSGQPDTVIIGGNFSVGMLGISREDTSIEGLANVISNSKRKFDYELLKVNAQNGSLYYDNLRRESLEFFLRQDSVVFFFTSWCNFPLYQVDYGWGKPLSVATLIMPYKNCVFLMDTRSGNGIEAWFTMGEDEMAMLPTELLSLENSDLYT